MTSPPHNLEAARSQEAELDAIEAALLRQDLQLRYRHTMAAARLAASRDRQQALAVRKQALDAGGGSTGAAGTGAADDLELCAQLSDCGGARLTVAAQRRAHLALLAAALQHWERHLAEAEERVDRAILAADAREATWVEREPGWRRSGTPPTAGEAVALTRDAVELPHAPPPAQTPTEPQPAAHGVAAAATRLPLPLVSGRHSTAVGAAGDAQLGDAPQPRGPTKRMTTTPVFRPADSATVTGSVLLPAAAPASASKGKSETRPIAALPTAGSARLSRPSPAESTSEPQPRARVLVDSSPELLSRHAETVTIDAEGAAAVATAARLRARKRQDAPPVRKRESQELPSEMPVDLPNGHPQPAQRHRDATAPFLATLTYCGLPLMRQAIEYDPGGRNLLLSFHGAAPALQTDGELLWRDRDGTRHRFSVHVLQAVPAKAGGTVVVLDIGHWSAEDRVAMQTVMARLM